jgi:DNA-binding NtrC family response regulator
MIPAELSGVLRRSVPTATYDDCRRKIAWHRNGLLLLVVGATSDLEPLKQLVRECRLRRSPLTIVVLEANATSGADCREELESFIAGWLSWPDSADDLGKLVGSDFTVENKKESLAEVLADNLRPHTPSLAHLAGRLAIAALHDVSVLLTGETGTGKTFFARLLHNHSTRRNERFLVVPCGAQPPELFESAFFGHAKGSFTGAHQTQPGKFACAGKGTILLDEIDTLGFEQQAALLRVIESGEYEMVGSNQTLKSEARLIVASNLNLEEAVERGQFRQDLFYRLNVMAFHFPPLRERQSDIEFLSRAFAAQFSAKYHKSLTDIAPEAMESLRAFSWPGNVRQLENAIQQAVLVSEDLELTLPNLPEEVRRHVAVRSTDPILVGAENTNGHLRLNGPQPGGSLMRNRAEYERTLIQQTLDACHNNRSSAARALGISRVTLHKKIKQFRL